ncbi:hypothetical protein [Adhaeribacter radiodurans]|uniref:Uncharacterized protein n=1 Tax=Adhaeribacter radiodurans TaxID=2745197 RepID=A0A7L7LA54_9BACT|nr:hypothetical protein [Adhaeribacter radiodurans]QMU29708.1 hypothetical protein HUW48_17490 [Adhaeribacter radiodurans]
MIEFISLTLFVFFLVVLHRKANFFGLTARLEPVVTNQSCSNKNLASKKKPMLDF